MENEALQKYLEKLIHLQEHSSERFTEDNFRIAIDSLGLSDKEKEDLDQEFEQQFKRGSNYYRSHNYKKAIEHLEMAQHLEPFHLAAMMLLTDSYKLLYLETFNRKYYDKIIELCKRGLQLQSFNPYFAKIETLADKCEAARKSRLNRFLITVGLIAFVGLAAFSIYTMKWAELGPLSTGSTILSTILAFSMVPTNQKLFKLRKQLKKTTITLKFIPKGK